jgi:hypothetical protein
MEMAEGALNNLDNELFKKAEQSLKAADHLAYIIYPLLKDEKLLKKIFDEISSCTINLINSVLFHEYKKGVRLSQDKRQNLEIFKRVSLKFLTVNELESLANIFDLVDQHNKSSFDFIRKDKFIIMINGSKTEAISLEKIKSYINVLKTASNKFFAYKNL